MLTHDETRVRETLEKERRRRRRRLSLHENRWRIEEETRRREWAALNG